jgi:hypothetical protein
MMCKGSKSAEMGLGAYKGRALGKGQAKARPTPTEMGNLQRADIH